MTEVLGCVLAGGLARRMGGGDKGLISLGRRPLLDRVIERIKPQVSSLVINANGDPARFMPFEVPVIPDTIDGFPGPLAGVLAALEWARDCLSADWVATVATDTPFYPHDLVARLLEPCEDGRADLAAASSRGRAHPVFGLWPVRLADDLRRAMTEEGLRKVDLWTARHRLAVVEFPADGFDPFFNVNRPEDLAEAEALIEACDP